MDNKMKLSSLMWGQSSKTTQSKVETHQNFVQCKGSYDSLNLLKILREFFRSDDRQYKCKAEDRTKCIYYNLRQTPEMSCQEYFERVRNVVNIIKSLGGTLVDEMHFIDELPPNANGHSQDQINQAKEQILEKKISYGLLVRADRNRYGKLIEEVENSYLKENNDYPRTPTEAYNLLVNHKNYNSGERNLSQTEGLDQVAFVMEGIRIKSDGNFPHIKCFKCNKYGHYKSNCPEKEGDEEREELESEVCQVITAMTLMTKVSFLNKEEIDPMWILCDNESTVNIFKNDEILTNIKRTDKPIEITGVGGQLTKITLEGGFVRIRYGLLPCRSGHKHFIILQTHKTI
jgi:hypothetical protein